MKHWFFAFAAVVLIASVAKWQGWDVRKSDPVRERAELVTAIRHAEELRALYAQHRDLLIRIEYLSEMSFPGREQGPSLEYAREWVDDLILWNREDLERMRESLNQGQ